MAINTTKRGPLSTAEGNKANAALMKGKKLKVSIIFNIATHRVLKSFAGMEGKKISDIVEEVVYAYLKERGKVV